MLHRNTPALNLRCQVATLIWFTLAWCNPFTFHQAAGQTRPKNQASAAIPPFSPLASQFDTVIELKGTLKNFQRNLIVITRDDGTDVTVKLHDDPTRLRFVADAKPAFVRPQMMARTSVSLGPAGAPTSPVDHVELFQPVPPASLPGSAKEAFTPGIHASGHERPNPQQGFTPGNYMVVGMVVGIDDNGIYLNIGRGPMPIPMSPTAKIGLAYHNLSLAQIGDPVTVSGFHQPPDETQVVASQVTVRPERVFGEQEENPRRRTTRTTRTRAKAEPDAPVATDDSPAAQPD